MPSGKSMMRGVPAGRIFLIFVPFNTNTDVAPVSATACVGGIAGFLGCVIMPHNSCDLLMLIAAVTEVCVSAIVFAVS